MAMVWSNIPCGRNGVKNTAPVNNATLKAISLEDGTMAWGKRGLGKGSLILADGKLYFTNEEGITVVLKAGPEFEVMAENPLDGTYDMIFRFYDDADPAAPRRRCPHPAARPAADRPHPSDTGPS